MNTNLFSLRHIGPRKNEISNMLETVHAATIDNLISETIPGNIILKEPLPLPGPVSEYDYLKEIRSIASMNKLFKTYIGLGYHGTISPSVIIRNIFENPGWYTAYTPYQAEISQGRLEALFNFQTMVSDLTGLPVANASLLDEPTAAAEAMIMFYNSRSRDKNADTCNQFFVSDECYPQTIDVLKTRSVPLGIVVVVGKWQQFTPGPAFFGCMLQYPASNGMIHDYTEFISSLAKYGIKTVMAADILSLALLKPPGEMGADAAVGSTQRFGVPMGFGGPHAAYFASKEEFKRFIPGRIIGLSVDSAGNPAYRMALQMREQHIKREKATSNICTSQVLLAVMAGMYAVYHGPEGLKSIAGKIHHLAVLLTRELQKYGYAVNHSSFFDTISITPPVHVTAEKIRAAALARSTNFRYAGNQVYISVDEPTDEEDIGDIIRILREASGMAGTAAPGEKISSNGHHSALSVIPEQLRRSTPFLQHPVFNSYHSETEIMRYIKTLENRDVSLTHSMISLGSCTMKLNAAAEMIPLLIPEFSSLHPFIPADQAEGYKFIIAELEKYLCTITGFSGVSFQPNSGAQGEYTGLLVIREYFRNRGEPQRNVALIPQSAHGTNPASAAMAGMEIVIVKCNEKGNIDLNDLRTKAVQHKEKLAALMVTYPSTHGVFEEDIMDICKIIHENGGQVYMDGANLNAMVGLSTPAFIGADVCHINLHKTFGIPHGGGGPGMGPIAVRQHLTPYLPGHCVVKTGREKSISAVSSAPYGSALILLISYGYIKMLGNTGLTQATKFAILNANYLACRLKDHYPVLYSGKNGRVAHEFIADCRDFKRSAGVDVVDIAKRLMDYGFHAPTVSFPVPGTLMIEPTESESKYELDRFCEAMIAIRDEIREIEEGRATREDNVLTGSPHTASAAASDRWPHSYSREKAVFPVVAVKKNKVWPSCGRIDNAYGDRNLVCTCQAAGITAAEEHPVRS